MAVMATEARDRLVEAAESGALDPEVEALGVDLLGIFGSAARPDLGIEPHDLDIAARFDGPILLLELIDLLTTLTGFDRIDVAVVEGRQPVLDAEALCGIPLYERDAGAFAEAQMAALAHRRDTAFFRDLDLRRLRLMSDALDHLQTLDGTSGADLDARPLQRAAAERLLQVVVDLALDVNGHVVVALTGRAPQTGRESFTDLAACGIITHELAGVLAPSAGMRNVLVHHYVDVRTDLVAAAITKTLAAYPAYVEALAEYLIRLNR